MEEIYRFIDLDTANSRRWPTHSATHHRLPTITIQEVEKVCAFQADIDMNFST
jgi:hypothetical protein